LKKIILGAKLIKKEGGGNEQKSPFYNNNYFIGRLSFVRLLSCFANSLGSLLQLFTQN
jgi:hypothetical protein